MDLSPLIISLKVSVIATLINFFLGLFFAVKVSKMSRLKNLADGLLTLPMILPPTVIGFFLLMIFGRNGLLGDILYQAGFSVVFTWQGAVIAAVVVSFPLMYRTTRGAIEQMYINQIYAARTLGISEKKIFWKLIVPGCRPGIMAGIILSFSRALGEFGATAMLAGNIPGKTQTMSLAIYTYVQGNNRPEAFKWVLVIMLISFCSLFIMNSGYQERTIKNEVKPCLLK
jgi:molybdate transport system permease protein